ncbi:MULTISPECIES: DUF397 domain-containing protein [unclassified Streptomyces]|uniref:DUF397 domain-containing protein n=1 Tax=unclassified Streptomyces TaxID=2593676 RepID=UPI00382D6595
MTSSDLMGAVWHRSSRSQNNGQCVEVAFLTGGRVALRDSKGGGVGAVLVFRYGGWDAFESSLVKGDFEEL